MTVRACLFDLDGVLVDTAKFHYLAWKNLADRLRINFTLVDNEQLKGVSRMDSLEILLDLGKISISAEEKKRVAAEKNKLYLDYVRQMTPEDVLPGVKEFLIDLKANGIRVGLGSASKNARLILEKTKIAGLFDVIIDGNLTAHAKPHPEVYALGARMLELPAEDCVVFEDAIAGIQSAHNAGMKCIGIGSPDILHEADLVFPGFTKLKPGDLIFS